MKAINGIRSVSYDAINRRSYISVVAAATSYTLWTLSAGKRAFLRKIRWLNRTGGNGYLDVGYLTNAAFPVFVACMPRIFMLNGADDGLTEKDLICIGNSAQGGFQADTTANIGTLGDIIIQSTVGAGAPTDVMVSAEIEEI